MKMKEAPERVPLRASKWPMKLKRSLNGNSTGAYGSFWGQCSGLLFFVSWAAQDAAMF